MLTIALTDLLKSNFKMRTTSLSALGSVLAAEAFVATPNRYRGYIELGDPLINVHDLFN